MPSSPSPQPRVLVPADIHTFGALPGLLRDRGCEVVEVEAGDRDRLASLLPETDVFVGMPRFPLDAEMLAAAPRLRAANSLVIGVDHIDVDACSAAGVIVGNGAVPEIYLGMAEATVLLILALTKDLKARERALREGGYRPPATGAFLLQDKTIGLIGLGRIGRNVVERLQGWGVRLLGYDPYVTPTTAPPALELVALDDLLRRSDVVSIHTPLTAQTRGLLGARELGLMRPTAYLLNTARGGILDEQALADALNTGRLAGAAIDAFAEEPPRHDNPLFSVDPDKLILTGHCIGHGVELPPAVVRAGVENVLRKLRGELPLYVVNPEAESRWRERLARIAPRPASPA